MKQKGNKIKSGEIAVKKTIALIFAIMIMLTGCGKSEFRLTENTEKQMTITADNADREASFLVGTLEASDGEQIVIAAKLTKGSVRVEIVGVPADQSINELPATDAEVIFTADVTGTEGTSGMVPAGSYMLRATCLEKATGTIQIEVKPGAYSEYIGKQYSGNDPWGNPLSITLKGMYGNEVSFAYEAVIGEGEYIRTFLTASSGEMKDGILPFHVAATAEEYEAMHCDYRGTLTLKNGSLFVTYDAGSVVEESPEGGSAGYQAMGLKEEEKTVELMTE